MSLKRRKKRILWAVLLLLLVSGVAWYSGALAWWPSSQAEEAVRAQQLDHAEEFLKQALVLAPEDPQIHFQMARLQRKQGNLSEFAKSLSQAVELGLDRKLAMNEKLLAQAQSGRIDSIRSKLDQMLIQGEMDGEEVLAAYVNGCLASARLADAETLIDGWKSTYPQSPHPWYFSGRLLMHHEQLSQAEQQFLQAVNREPEHVGSLYLLGQIQMQQNRPEEAIEWFRKASVLKFHAAPRIGQAKALRSVGRIDEAREILENIAAMPPSAVKTSFRRVGDRFEGAPAELELGRLELAVGQAERAVYWLNQAVEANPGDLSARHARGMALRDAGNLEEAQRVLEEVREARIRLSEVDELADLVRDNPSLIEERVRIGELYARYESKLTAEFWLKSAIARDPDHQKAHRLLAEIYEQRAEQDPAYRSLAESHRQQSQ